jgi:hypothetical protein
MYWAGESKSKNIEKLSSQMPGEGLAELARPEELFMVQIGDKNRSI